MAGEPGLALATRWERGEAMELWQSDLVGGFLLADGSQAMAVKGIDDHSRFCVSPRLMARERTQSVWPSPITARTALYLCSATLIALMRGSVKHQPK